MDMTESQEQLAQQATVQSFQKADDKSAIDHSAWLNLKMQSRR
jgi:hypothetical protein